MYVVDTSVEGVLGMDVLPEIGLCVGKDDRLVFSLEPGVTVNGQMFDKSINESVLTSIDTFEIICLEPNTVPKRCV